MKTFLLIFLSSLLFTGPKETKQPENIISGIKNTSNTITAKRLNTTGFLAGLVSLQSDYIKCHLIIDHQFVYNNPMVNYKISVTGRIPVQYEENFAVKVKLYDKEYIDLASTLTGSGKLKVSGRGSMNAGSFQVNKINYDSEIHVNIQGKTRYLEQEDGSVIPVMNLALKETWNGDLKWDIETSDPENDDVRYNMLTKIVPTKIPDSPHTGKTLEYITGYLYEDQTFGHTSSVPGMGTFRWRYTISYTYVKGKSNTEPKLTVNPKDQSRFDDNRPKPEDYVKTYEPRLGPPLESIVWEIIDLDKL
ncbi:MAG: hypothetical protein JXN62_03450 [Bacteroidales bacterium]|nr:hypothetical protein [Bacteroidales bacterium]